MTELETKLRDLNLWEEAKNNCIKQQGEKGFNKHNKNDFSTGLDGMFVFRKTKQGHAFWWDIKTTHNI